MQNKEHHCKDITFTDGYLNLIRSTKFVSARDPEGLLVSGTINKNGTVRFDPFVYLPNTTLDIEPGEEGDYYFVLLDENKKVLSKTGFFASFYMPAHMADQWMKQVLSTG